VEKQKRRDYLESLAPGFAEFVEGIKWKRRDKMVLKLMSERFLALKAVLEQHGLSVETHSKPCVEFITTGSEDIEDAIERQFVFAQDSYWQLIREKEELARTRKTGDLYSSEMRLEMARECEEAAKMELCVEFLLDGEGLTLPRKWESCRARLDEVTAASGGDPLSMMDYIYTGVGEPSTLEDDNDSSVSPPTQI
jgi:hypothetical protein